MEEEYDKKEGENKVEEKKGVWSGRSRTRKGKGVMRIRKKKTRGKRERSV